MKDPSNEELFGSLARDLSAAWIAHRLRVRPAWARKRYVPDDKPVDQYWLAMAMSVDREISERLLGGDDDEIAEISKLIQ